MTLYLILHKVHGEAAFDVAQQMEVGGETWWIIPTSGHRAYPYWHEAIAAAGYLDYLFKNPPADLRDHYEVSRDPPARDYTDRATEPPRSGRPIVPTLEDI